MDAGIDATGNDIVVYHGMRFVRDKKVGYYRANNPGNIPKTVFLHRIVWIINNGEIPKGYHIHHKDGNRANNLLENLDIMNGQEHLILHNSKLTGAERQRRRMWMREHVIPMASKWHKSKEGHDWHVRHFEKCSRPILFREREVVCIVCGRRFTARNHAMYCSKKCWIMHNGR